VPLSSATTISTRIKDGLVVTSGAEFSEELLAGLTEHTLEQVRSHGIRTVVFELSALKVLDRTEFRALQAIQRMLRVLGASSVMVGLRPGIVMYLVESDEDFSDIRAFRTLEDALRALSLSD
jgi:rsbT antagonist protein RsbS